MASYEDGEQYLAGPTKYVRRDVGGHLDGGALVDSDLDLVGVDHARAHFLALTYGPSGQLVNSQASEEAASMYRYSMSTQARHHVSRMEEEVRVYWCTIRAIRHTLGLGWRRMWWWM